MFLVLVLNQPSQRRFVHFSGIQYFGHWHQWMWTQLSWRKSWNYKYHQIKRIRKKIRSWNTKLPKKRFFKEKRCLLNNFKLFMYKNTILIYAKDYATRQNNIMHNIVWENFHSSQKFTFIDKQKNRAPAHSSKKNIEKMIGHWKVEKFQFWTETQKPRSIISAVTIVLFLNLNRDSLPEMSMHYAQP